MIHFCSQFAKYLVRLLILTTSAWKSCLENLKCVQPLLINHLQKFEGLIKNSLLNKLPFNCSLTSVSSLTSNLVSSDDCGSTPLSSDMLEPHNFARSEDALASTALWGLVKVQQVLVKLINFFLHLSPSNGIIFDTNSQWYGQSIRQLPTRMTQLSCWKSSIWGHVRGCNCEAVVPKKRRNFELSNRTLVFYSKDGIQ